MARNDDRRPPARHRRRSAAAVLTTAMLAVVPISPAQANGPTVPTGYRLVSSKALAAGVEHWTLRSDEPAQDVHVARLAPGLGSRLLPVLANGVLTGTSTGERTSAMCARANCVVAVNGDFWGTDGLPIGAMVAAGELITTPGIDHILFRLDGQGRPTLRPGIDWSVAVKTVDGQGQAVTSVNRPAGPDAVTLYSRRWGLTTPPDAGAVEVTLEFVVPSSAALPSGVTAVRVGAVRTGGSTPVLPGQLVLTGRSAAAGMVAALAQRAASTLGGIALLDVNLGGVVSAIGGSPQLLQDGQVAFPTGNLDSFTQNRHPRTMIGVTSGGEILLVTADRTSTSSGLTLREAADLLARLGAVDAVNLDGGGSTTFVTGGDVRNRPSEGAERPVVSVLALTGDPDLIASLLNQLGATLNGLLQPK